MDEMNSVFILKNGKKYLFKIFLLLSSAQNI